MKQGLLLLQCRPPPLPPLHNASSLRTRCSTSSPIAAAIETSSGGQLTARERRQLRNERRESRAESGGWREEVEDRLLNQPKRRKGSWMEDLNLDRLALLGPQWWVIRVSRVTGHEIAERLARSLSIKFPNVEFKVYFPSVRERRKLKKGSDTIKLKPLFPGCLFLHCILNKDIHDFIKEYDGIGGFLGSKVGNTKRQINKPKPVPVNDVEKIFLQAKEEQRIYDEAFEASQRVENTNSSVDSTDLVKSTTDAKPRRRSRKGSATSGKDPLSSENHPSLIPGATVRVLSGDFQEFKGYLRKLDHKAGKATVGFMLFGKESFVDLEVGQIALETT